MMTTKDRNGTEQLNTSRASVCSVLGNGNWLAIGVAIDQADPIFAPVYAEVVDGRLKRWTTKRPDCFAGDDNPSVVTD